MAETTVVLGRKRRHWPAVAGAAVVVVLAVTAGLAVHGRDDAAPPAAFAVPSVVPSVPVSVAPVDGRLGDVVATGLPASGGQTWVLYFTPIDWDHTPGIRMGLSIGERDARGTIEEALNIAVTSGSDRTAGFHPMQAPMQLEDRVVQPAFGYYVGRPARITATFDGVTTVNAVLAPWSADPDVTIFWFDPAAGAVEEISQLGAFDAAGARLPDGIIKASYF
jgi:hypothetical protein